MNESLRVFLTALWKRSKSFLWRFAFALITYAIAWLTDNVGLLELHPAIAAIIVLGLGEISKAWANFMEGKDRNYFGFKK